MTQEEIEEGNKLIAEFMGFKMVYHQGELAKGIKKELWRRFPDEDDSLPMGSLSISQFRYHYSWDMLMPVVEKIESMGYQVNITNYGCNIQEYEKAYKEYSNISVAEDGALNKITNVYKAVVQFIKYYNDNKKNK